jgi:hypothetical protein
VLLPAPLARAEDQVDPVEDPRAVVLVAEADAVEAERAARDRAGAHRFGDRRLAVDHRLDPRRRDGAVVDPGSGGAERRDRLEGGHRQERQRRQHHAVEGTRGDRRDRHGEHRHHGRARDRGEQSGGEATGGGVAPLQRGETGAGTLGAADPVLGPPVDGELRRAGGDREHLPGQIGARRGLAAPGAAARRAGGEGDQEPGGE